MNSLPAELKVAVAAELVHYQRRSLRSLSMINRTWRNTVQHLIFDRVQWDTAKLATDPAALATFLGRTGYRIKFLRLTLRFRDEAEPEHEETAALLATALSQTPALASIDLCAMTSGRATHEGAAGISIHYAPVIRAIERLSNLYEITYTEFCRRYGGPFLLLVLGACSSYIERIILRAPMFCKKLDAALSNRSFPAVHTLELHDNAELDSPADIFPSVEDLTIRSEHGAFTEFPINLCQAFAQTLTTLRLDGVGCANATPMLSLPGLRNLYIDQAVPAVIPLFTRTPVVEIEVLNAAQPHVGVFLNAMRGAALPYARLARIALYPRSGRRAKRLFDAPGLGELQEICDARGILLEIVIEG